MASHTVMALDGIAPNEYPGTGGWNPVTFNAGGDVNWFDPRDFGTWADGVDGTTALAAALAAAGVSGGPAVVSIPAISNFAGALGVYIHAFAAVYGSSPNNWAGSAPVEAGWPLSFNAGTIVLPDNVTLFGWGWGSMLTVNPTDMTAMAANVTVPWITMGNNTTIYGVHFDGAGTAWTNAGNFLFTGVCAGSPLKLLNHMLIDSCYFTNATGPAGNPQNGYMCTAGYTSTDVTIRNCIAYKVGQAWQIGIYQPGHAGTTCKYIRLENCHALACTYGGPSFYGASVAHVVGCETVAQTANATPAGFNVEWSQEIYFDGCRSDQCQNGLIGAGNCTIYWTGGALRRNGTYGINFTASGLNAWPATPGGSNFTSGLQRFEMIGTLVDKGTTGHALFVGATATSGNPDNPLSVPSAIRIQTPDIATWVIVNSQQSPSLVPATQLSLPATLTPVALGTFTGTWVAGSGVTVSSYGSAVPAGTNPAVVAIGNAGTGDMATASNVLLAKNTYRIRYCVACSNATGGGQYRLRVIDSSSAVLLNTAHPADSSVFGSFVFYDGYVTIGANAAKIAIGSASVPNAGGFTGVWAFCSADLVQLGGETSGN